MGVCVDWLTVGARVKFLQWFWLTCGSKSSECPPSADWSTGFKQAEKLQLQLLHPLRFVLHRHNQSTHHCELVNSVSVWTEAPCATNCKCAVLPAAQRGDDQQWSLSVFNICLFIARHIVMVALTSVITHHRFSSHHAGPALSSTQQGGLENCCQREALSHIGHKGRAAGAPFTSQTSPSLFRSAHGHSQHSLHWRRNARRKELLPPAPAVPEPGLQQHPTAISDYNCGRPVVLTLSHHSARCPQVWEWRRFTSFTRQTVTPYCTHTTAYLYQTKNTSCKFTHRPKLLVMQWPHSVQPEDRGHHHRGCCSGCHLRLNIMSIKQVCCINTMC